MGHGWEGRQCRGRGNVAVARPLECCTCPACAIGRPETFACASSLSLSLLQDPQKKIGGGNECPGREKAHSCLASNDLVGLSWQRQKVLSDLRHVQIELSDGEDAPPLPVARLAFVAVAAEQCYSRCIHIYIYTYRSRPHPRLVSQLKLNPSLHLGMTILGFKLEPAQHPI